MRPFIGPRLILAARSFSLLILDSRSRIAFAAPRPLLAC